MKIGSKSIFQLCEGQLAALGGRYTSSTRKPRCQVASGGGSVGRVVTSATRDAQFESQHRLYFIYQLYIFIEKTKIKKKRPGLAHSKRKTRRKESKKPGSFVLEVCAEVDEIKKRSILLQLSTFIKPNNPQPFKPRIFLINGN